MLKQTSNALVRGTSRIFLLKSLEYFQLRSARQLFIRRFWFLYHANNKMGLNTAAINQYKYNLKTIDKK